MAIRKAHVWTGAGVAICCSFLMAREGFEPVAKHETIDPPNVITWCYGRTNFDDPTVAVGTLFTKEQCAAQLAESLQKYAAPVRDCLPNFDDMPPSRQAALVSFAYNLGANRLCTSSVARRLNAGDVVGACEAMVAYVYVSGKVCDDAHCGLGKRRRAERALCLQGGVQ
jgi:lysozyme